MPIPNMVDDKYMPIPNMADDKYIPIPNMADDKYIPIPNMVDDKYIPIIVDNILCSNISRTVHILYNIHVCLNS